jgi:uncharacterized protein (TIGR02246 family)
MQNKTLYTFKKNEEGRMKYAIFGAVFITAVSLDLWADQSTPEEVSLAFEQAFNQHDAKKLSDLWAADAVYTDPDGNKIVGRDEILKGYEQNFKENPQIKLNLSEKQVKLLAPNLAQQEGTATTTGDDGEQTRYLAYFVLNGDIWELISFTEAEVIKAPSNYEHLKQLEWLIGDYVDSSDEGDVQVLSRWSKNQNFIVRTFKATIPPGDEFEGTQIVGWDPGQKLIRSWTFDSDGGFSDGTWKNIKDQWYINSKSVLPDGKIASVTNIVKKISDTSYSWSTKGLTIDGELQPDISEITLKKVQGENNEKTL